MGGSEPNQLGDFVVGREIGRGGMGVVYEARQVSLNRRVALKVLRSGAALPFKAIQRFRREAEAAACLHHTNIVPIYATGEQDGAHFYAMELVEGPSLDDVIRQLKQVSAEKGSEFRDDVSGTSLAATAPYVPSSNSLSSKNGLSGSSLTSGSAYFDTVARMIAEVADALDYAHREGVIHRDIKPSNLLVAPNDHLCVSDFGLARMLEQPGMTLTGELVGTPRYMSPEQITAGRAPVDHRTDIYSLGATVYELLTLQPPYPAEQRDQLLAEIIHKSPTQPRKIERKIPFDLETICLKAMAKDPDRRYQTAGEMADDLKRYVNRFAIRARRTGPIVRGYKWIKRNPAFSTALAVVALSAVIAVGFGFRAHQAERRRAEAQAKHDGTLLTEKRRFALEKAVLAARLEDFNDAREAIRAAEQLGCSAGQVRMLYGQLELYQANYDKAVEHLTEATNLLPTSVAAWSMLAVAQSNCGQGAEYEQALARAAELEAESPEDYLFRGHAESILDPARGLQLMDEAIRRRPSVLARLLRLDAARRQILDSPSSERARQAIQDARFIKQYHPDNPAILSVSLWTHCACSHVFSEASLDPERLSAFEEASKDAAALERYPDLPIAVLARWAFVEGTDREAQVVGDLRRVAENTGDPVLVMNYASALYREQKYEQAYDFLATKEQEPFLGLHQAIIVAELNDGVSRATRLVEEILAREPGAWDLFNCQLVLRLLGQKPEAVEVSRTFLRHADRFPTLRKTAFREALEYCADQRSEENLLDSCRNSRLDVSNAHLCIALSSLAEGKRYKARVHLQKCLDTHYVEALPYSLALLLRARMTQDAAWPPWIAPAP